jgi:hypothetical protein
MTEPVLPQSETPMTPLDTVTSGFNPHAVPSTETSPLMTEPLLPQLETPPDQSQPTSIPKPAHWNKMSARAKTNWRNRNK